MRKEEITFSFLTGRLALMDETNYLFNWIMWLLMK